MPRYEVSCLTTIVTATAGTPISSLRAAGKSATLRELHIWAVTAPTTRGALALAMSTALGTGALTNVIPVAYDPHNAVLPTALAITAWATLAPTVGTWMRRYCSSPAIGQGIVWTFGAEGLTIPCSGVTSNELVLLNASATAPGTWDVTYVYDE